MDGMEFVQEIILLIVCGKRGVKKKWFILHFRTFFGGVSHVKNSKKWKWDSGRPPPPLFFQNSHIFPFFLGDVPELSNLGFKKYFD